MSLWRSCFRCVFYAKGIFCSMATPKAYAVRPSCGLSTAPSDFKNQGDPPEGFSETNVTNSYSGEQQDIILKVLNSSSVEELRQYELTKTRATNLVRHRRRYGSFKKLEEILEVEGFGVGFVRSFCDSVVYGLSDDSKQQQNCVWQQICHPSVSESLKQKLSSVVSLEILPHEVLWLHLSRDLKILEWELAALGEGTRSYNHKISLEMAHQILKKLPEADAYLMERRQLRARQSSVIPMVLGTVQIESMLMALLNGNFATNSEHHVFTIKNSVVGRFFSLKVGNEMVSTQNVVKNLLSGLHCMDLRRIHVDPSVLFWYNGQHSAAKEELASLLLRAMAFYELEIIRNKS